MDRLDYVIADPIQSAHVIQISGFAPNPIICALSSLKSGKHSDKIRGPSSIIPSNPPDKILSD